MKLSKFLLMGLLASGLMLSACNTNDNPSEGDPGDTILQVSGKTFNFKEFVSKGYSAEDQAQLDQIYGASTVRFDEENIYLRSDEVGATIVGSYTQEEEKVNYTWVKLISDDGKEHSVMELEFETEIQGNDIDIAVEGPDGACYVTYSLAID